MKNITLKTSIGIILIIAFMSIPAVALKHEESICWGCHINGKFSYVIDTEDDGDYCTECHKYATQQARETMHNPKTCIICHSAKDSKTFHTIHVNETCARCHGETGNAIPDKKMEDCGGCHGGQLHVIHQKNIDQLCETCHGSVPPTSPQQRIGKSKTVDRLYAKIVDYQQYTLFEILKNLMGWK